MSILVGRKAPDFCSAAVTEEGKIVENFKLSSAIENKYALIFFYPLDFTFVCPSELIALNNRMDKFISLGVKVIAVSIDSQFTHLAWRNTPIENGGISEVKYTMVADVSHSICQSYGVEHPDANVAFRGAFVVDNQGIVRSQIVNDLPIGRNIDEIIRTFEAVQFHEKVGEVCPAGWKKDKKGMIPTADGVASYLKNNADNL